MSTPAPDSATGVSWRLERWPTDRCVDHLIFTDMFAVPTERDFRRAAATSARRGAHAIRTSALFPASQLSAELAGFVPIDHLQLLKLVIDDHHKPLSTTHHATNPLRLWHLSSASEVDRASFGPVWGNSAHSLHQIFGATERARGRICQTPGSGRSSVDGFAMSGITDLTGYIQRLAVRPETRRQGMARALIADSLDWMARKGVATVFVNTGVTNTSALSLYSDIGFEPTGETLSIHERLHNYDEQAHVGTPHHVAQGTESRYTKSQHTKSTRMPIAEHRR